MVSEKKIPVEDYLNQIKKKTTKYFPLDIISRKISILRMFRRVIDMHPEDLEESYLKTSSEIKNFEYGDPLNDYILLEISDFYRSAYLKFGKKIKLPLSSKDTKTFRDEIVGHLKKKDVEEIIERYIKTNKVSFKKIFNDWVEFRDKIFERIKKEGKKK